MVGTSRKVSSEVYWGTWGIRITKSGSSEVATRVERGFLSTLLAPYTCWSFSFEPVHQGSYGGKVSVGNRTQHTRAPYAQTTLASLLA